MGQSIVKPIFYSQMTLGLYKLEVGWRVSGLLEKMQLNDVLTSTSLTKIGLKDINSQSFQSLTCESKRGFIRLSVHWSVRHNRAGKSCQVSVSHGERIFWSRWFPKSRSTVLHSWLTPPQMTGIQTHHFEMVVNTYHVKWWLVVVRWQR